MKTHSLLILMTLTIFSCEREDDTHQALKVLSTLRSDNGLTYNESLALWKELKNNNGNSYIYHTEFTSWTGYGSTTEIIVRNGNVTERSYEAFRYDASINQKEIIDSYREDKTNLGSHEKGAKQLTIDELYGTCAGDYLVADVSDNTLYFQTAENGLMTFCGYHPNGCMDDCFRGIRITGFEWMQ
jgi:hypothetical protein